ncbi:cell division protein ZapE [Nakamurella deserti]|uniref:cell division protein ZapE n=1 Tax=Nakamurella deserti TaxID=2164074 RepID=UPI000DBE926A|nr:cell division protein ZapE [Nakamurella deserti]
MSLVHLVDIEPVISTDELIDGLVPPPRFGEARFSTYRPNPGEPSQAAALAALEQFADKIAAPPAKKGLFRRTVAPAAASGVYLDGGFGVGKTHLLASLWHAVPGPKAYATFGEMTQLVGMLGFVPTIKRLADHRLIAIDEFELDDPGDTMLMTRLLGELAEAGVSIAATSNTLPDKLGEGRFAAEDFRREIQALSSRFATIRVDGPDFRHQGLAEAPPPMTDAQLQLVAGEAAAHGDSSLDGFEALCRKLAKLHPSKYGRLLDGIGSVGLSHVRPAPDQSVALRLVTFIDRLYDRSIPVSASGGSLGELFTPEMLRGGYRKKYLRATSRILALARDAQNA